MPILLHILPNSTALPCFLVGFLLGWGGGRLGVFYYQQQQLFSCKFFNQKYFIVMGLLDSAYFLSVPASIFSLASRVSSLKNSLITVVDIWIFILY